MSKVKTVKRVVCVVCKCRVRTTDAVPYGESAVCLPCDRDVRDEDREQERYFWDMEMSSVRDRLGW